MSHIHTPEEERAVVPQDGPSCYICLLTDLRVQLAGIRAFEELGPGVHYSIADCSGYENTHWVWHETVHGGDGLIYAAKSLLEACQMFDRKEGGVDHP